jgi:hypothetical protein
MSPMLHGRKRKKQKKKKEKINPLSLEEFHFQMYENSKHIHTEQWEWAMNVCMCAYERNLSIHCMQHSFMFQTSHSSSKYIVSTTHKSLYSLLFQVQKFKRPRI